MCHIPSWLERMGSVFGLGTPEVLMIAVVALVLFGPARLPALAGSLGSAWREFQRSLQGLDAPPPPPAPPADALPPAMGLTPPAPSAITPTQTTTT
jgi:sec-independent protein translocase protein TatA